MHIQLVSSIFALILFLFAACAGSDQGDSDLVSAVPHTLPAGTEITINSTITMQTELSNGWSGTAYYINDDSTYFWQGEGVVDISFDRISTSIVLSFTTNDDNKVEFEMTDFVDIGQDGFIDEFTVVGKVNSETKISRIGQFRGDVRPRNLNVKDTIDFNRAPTQKEFEDNIGGMLLVQRETYPDSSGGGIARFNDDGTTTHFQLDGKPLGQGTYMYDNNDGDPRLISRGTATLKTPGLGDIQGITKYVIKLNFKNFYEGTYEVLESSFTFNDQTYYDDNLSKGDWFIMTTLPTP